MRVRVPLSSCDEAARYLVKCLGGEEKAREIVGGVKWWQVRGIEGCVIVRSYFSSIETCRFISVDAQWITAKKDWREAKKRYKMHQNQMSDAEPGSFQPSEQPARTLNGNMSGTYEKHMDEMRCVLYIHGGKSFGSDSHQSSEVRF